MSKVGRYAQAGSTITPISSVSSTGVASSYALADHAHAGLVNVALAGNTAGASTSLVGSLVIVGGSNVTLSATTAAGAMTISMIEAGSVATTTSSYWIPPIAVTGVNNLVGAMGSSAMLPLRMRSQITVSAMKSIFFQQAWTASSNSSVANTLALTAALFSVDTVNSSFVMLCSGSFSNVMAAATAASQSLLYQGNRTISLPFNTTAVLLQNQAYAMALIIASTTIATAPAPRISFYYQIGANTFADYTYGQGAWGQAVQGTTRLLPSEFPQGPFTGALAASMAFSKITNTAAMFFEFPAALV